MAVGVYAHNSENSRTPSSNSHLTMMGYRPNEAIVKFRDASDVCIRSNAKGRFVSSNVSALDKKLNAIGVSVAEQLMPLTGSRVAQAKMKGYNGKEIVDADMSKVYKLTFATDKGLSVEQVVSQLKDLSEVEYAEPNYLVYTLDAVDGSKDPMYPQQTYLNKVKAPFLWGLSATTGKRPVIAIIDTGVDISHPDLADNIWTNEREKTGVDGADDDNNGFKDDVHGWDFVNQTGDIGDWNGHGTHCAGIAAAVGNNNLGIIGANPNALIMPVTVMQSDGTGDVATIIKGIDYASANGADIISMSIGSYSHSIAEEQALIKAYRRSILVAAAGNNCLPITGLCVHCRTFGAPCFPAAFTFVLGVQAGDGVGAFSNYDNDGPVYSSFDEEKLYNYELSAPGVSIVSTYPNGRYKALSGTSMSCPLVAGAISRLLEVKEYSNNDVLFADLINTSGEYVDFENAYCLKDAERKPTLSFLNYTFEDEGDNDGRADAGETLYIYPTIKNSWGEARNIKLSIELAENEDPRLVEFLTPQTDMGLNLSAYAKSKSKNPLVIALSKDITDGRHIRLVMKATCDNITEEVSQGIILNVENGVELGGTQRENIILYPDVHYIVTRNWGIPKDVMVTVKAGTTIKIKDGVGVSNYGIMKFEGTPDSLITITKADLGQGAIGGFLNDNANYVNFENVVFDNLIGIDFRGHSYKHCIIRNCTSYEWMTYCASFTDCDIYNNVVTGGLYAWLSENSKFDECNIHNNKFITYIGSGGFGNASRFYHSNYINNEIDAPVFSTPGVYTLDESNSYGNYYNQWQGYYNIVHYTTEPEISYLSNCFLGTTNKDVASEGIMDETDNYGWGHVDLWKMSEWAFEEAPACVDYIKVDGYNPQDQADEMPPLGVGRHKVEIGFNRAMDQNVTPLISMGVRPPYTQIRIAEDGRWFDPYTYITYFTLDGKSATDGMNRLFATDFKQKGSDWVMPQENSRFNVQVQAAGSMSTGMLAEAGLGKVKLTWETDEEDFADLMGYNIYRFTKNELGESSDSIKINSNLIESSQTEYTDFDVTPGTTYYYFIREIGTDLSQNDVSRTVAATPLTAQKGDANGSMKVDIADVISEIAYLANEKPEPFIYEAADVNEDGTVNILDVVGTMRIITNPSVTTEAIEDVPTIYCWVKNGKLQMYSPVNIAGVQVRCHINSSDDIMVLNGLDGMEKLSAQIADNEHIFLAYSMSRNFIAAGDNDLLSITPDVRIEEIVMSTLLGTNVNVVMAEPTGIEQVAGTVTTTNRRGMYDIVGRRLKSEPRHGVIIVDGKKIVR